MNLRTALIGAIIIVHSSFAERYALLIGNNNARGDYAQLKYVENDINGLRSILNDFCGFEKRHIVTLYKGSPEDLDRLLTEIAKQVSQETNSMFLFYFSGHADQENLKMGNADFSLNTLKEKLTAFPADIRIGIFDACQSGSFTRLKGGVLSEPFLFKDDGKSKGQVFLSSSSVSENAQEFDAYRNSIFTFHLINALRGSADVSGDSKVTLSEAYHYAFNHTLSSTAGSSGGIQHPSYQFRIQGEGDIVLADLNIRSQGVLLSQDVWGAITIFNEQSSVVADLSKERNSSVMIALSPGNYRIVEIQGAQRFEASVALKGNGVAAIKETDFFQVKPKPYTTGKKGASASQAASQLGIRIAGVYERFNLSELSSSLQDRFSDYGGFSITPSLSFPSRVRHAAITAEAIFSGRFIARLGGGSFSFSSAADYAGSRVNEFDGKRYFSGLHLDKSLSVTILDLATGYRWTSGILRHFFIVAGLDVYQAELKISSVFTDSLFNVKTPGTETTNATMVLPYLSMGYAWPITRFCDIGSELRYRHQNQPKSFVQDQASGASVSDTLGTGNRAPIKADFTGFDFRVFATFNFKF